jgi:pyruvate/2-oxoglutarate dehydrogenase complex dihydrolipoamide acyltransferase (E2) component
MSAGDWKDNGDGTWTRTVGDTEETTGVNPYATTAALETAAELGVDINQVKGSGKDGSITKSDVEAAAK